MDNESLNKELNRFQQELTQQTNEAKGAKNKLERLTREN